MKYMFHLHNLFALYFLLFFKKIYVHVHTNYRPVARKIFQPRHYFKRCARIEFSRLRVVHHAGSKIVVQHFRGIQNVECVFIDSLTFLLLLLWMLAAKSTKNKGEKKVGNFNRGECPSSPHTGYGPELIARDSDQLESLSYFGHCARLLFQITCVIMFAVLSLFSCSVL